MAAGSLRREWSQAAALYGWRLEATKTNLVGYSEQFDNAAWTKARSSITANLATAPDGTATADKLVEDTTTSNTHTINPAPRPFWTFSISVWPNDSESWRGR